jgi:hypothetical protein
MEAAEFTGSHYDVPRSPRRSLAIDGHVMRGGSHIDLFFVGVREPGILHTF